MAAELTCSLLSCNTKMSSILDLLTVPYIFKSVFGGLENNALSRQSNFEIDWLRFRAETLTSHLNSPSNASKLLINKTYSSRLRKFPAASDNLMVFRNLIVAGPEESMFSKKKKIETPSAVLS